MLRHCTAPIVYADRSNREYRSRFASFSSAFELRRSFGANFRQFSSQRNFFFKSHIYLHIGTFWMYKWTYGCINSFFFRNCTIVNFLPKRIFFFFSTLLTHLDTFIREICLWKKTFFLLNRRCMETLRQIHGTLITIKEKISIDIIKFLFHDC